MLALDALYGIMAAWLAVYGLNSLTLTLAYLFVRNKKPKAEAPAAWPAVTVQLPVYNELDVVERLIEAAVSLDYPRELLQIQVLDDSTDATAGLVRRIVERHVRSGVNISQFRRPRRTGFKAGALAAALPHAAGELIAVFDSDFVPPTDFLRRMVPHFASPDVGCVQARWSHVNREYSSLTQVQAIAIDAHFIVEQTARSRLGLFLNFNGSAGIWRRSCIDDAGGWQADTLAEDLDLSYRAQLAGWRIVYVPDITAPAEIPPQLDALRRQQSRWAQGSIQVARKLLPALLQSRQPWYIKLEGLLHLTGYLAHPLILATLLLTCPAVMVSSRMVPLVGYSFLAPFGPPLLCLIAQMDSGPGWWRRLRFAPLLLLLGMGLAFNNTIAIARGILGKSGSFERTPKFNVQGPQQGWRQSRYALPCTPLVWYELCLALLAFAVVNLAVARGFRSISYWHLLFAGSNLYVSLTSLSQANRATSRHRARA